MPEADPQQLLSRLDQDCLDLLEKASRFCIQQSHREVRMEHLLLQMLDDSGNQLNRLLNHCGLNPLDWIRHLLTTIGKLQSLQSATPVFAKHLFSWFDEANQYCCNSSQPSITQQCLIETLLRSPGLTRALNLPLLTELSQQDIDSFYSKTNGSPDIIFAEEDTC